MFHFWLPSVRIRIIKIYLFTAWNFLVIFRICRSRNLFSFLTFSCLYDAFPGQSQRQEPSPRFQLFLSIFSFVVFGYVSVDYSPAQDTVLSIFMKMIDTICLKVFGANKLRSRKKGFRYWA